jgi:hypothetical protein
LSRHKGERQAEMSRDTQPDIFVIRGLLTWARAQVAPWQSRRRDDGCRIWIWNGRRFRDLRIDAETRLSSQGLIALRSSLGWARQILLRVVRRFRRYRRVERASSGFSAKIRAVPSRFGCAHWSIASIPCFSGAVSRAGSRRCGLGGTTSSPLTAVCCRRTWKESSLWTTNRVDKLRKR